MSAVKCAPNMAATESHFKKNARALGCDTVDFKPDLLPTCAAAAHTWRLPARQNCNRKWMNRRVCEPLPCELRLNPLFIKNYWLSLLLNKGTQITHSIVFNPTITAVHLQVISWPQPCYSRSQDGTRRGRPRADTVRELISEGETSSSRIRCSICNRVFPREKSLQAHKRTHTGPSYKCLNNIVH